MSSSECVLRFAYGAFLLLCRLSARVGSERAINCSLLSTAAVPCGSFRSDNFRRATAARHRGMRPACSRRACPCITKLSRGGAGAPTEEQARKRQWARGGGGGPSWLLTSSQCARQLVIIFFLCRCVRRCCFALFLPVIRHPVIEFFFSLVAVLQQLVPCPARRRLPQVQRHALRRRVSPLSKAAPARAPVSILMNTRRRQQPVVVRLRRHNQCCRACRLPG